MILRRAPAFGLSLLISSAATSLGQEKNFVKAELVTLSWQSNIKNLWFQAKEGLRKLDVYERDFTMPEEYTGPLVIQFYSDEATLRLPPKERPAPQAIAKLPASGGKVLLIFAPKPQGEIGWAVRVLDNSPVNFPPGAYRFMNLTQDPIQVALDQKVAPVKANSLTIIRPNRGEEVRDMPAQIGVGKNVVFSSIWGHREDRRTTVFVISDPNGRNGLGIRRFYEPVIKPVE